MPQDTCTLPDLCARVACLQSDFDTLWSDFYGQDERIYIATGNIGIPAAQDDPSALTQFEDDQIEYMRGVGVINGENPDGLFLLGGSNFDFTERLNAVSYPLINQELKTAGFSSLIAARKVFPVMGDYDYFIAFDKVSGTVPERMADTYLRLFDYIPDAKRYYSVYDDKTNTEFFVLSSGRYTDYTDPLTTGYIFPNDILVGDDQWDWLVQRCASTPARNRVVIFTDPFTSVPDSFKGERTVGNDNVFPDFATWDFASLGIKLIINGRAGNSFHLKKSSINIVNASAFSRSRFGITEVLAPTDPPPAPPLYGEAGYIVEYLSHQPMETVIRNVNVPNTGSDYYIIPKNEFFRMRCRKDGITCEFVSYDPYADSQQLANESQVIEHTFEISAI